MELEKWLQSPSSQTYGSKMKMVHRCMEASINKVTPETTMKTFVVQSAKAGELILGRRI